MHTLLTPEHIDAERSFVWCLGSTERWPGDADESDRYYLPPYALFMARPGRDIVIIPGDTATMHEVAAFGATFGLEPWQVIFTPGRRYELEKDLLNSRNALNLVRSTMARRGGEWLLVPYANNPLTEKLGVELGIPVFGDDREWVKRNGNKGVLYARPNGASADIPPEIRVVRGFLSTTVGELLEAYHRLCEQGVRRFMLKPAFGDGGSGIEMFDGKVPLEFFKNYRFPMGPVVLEEGIRLARDTDGNVITCSMHVCNGHIGPLCGQAVYGHTYSGNYAPFRSDELTAQAYAMVSAYSRRFQIQWGGIDFLLGRDGTLYFNDVNGGRMTEAYPLHFFGSRYAPVGAHIASCKFNPSLPISEWWQELHDRGMAHSLDGCGYGLAPICYSSDSATVAIVAESPEHADKLYADAEDLLPLG